ncbi:hypothetical protein BKA82DRAFT_4016109 [Pisolithus tinctorius]|nr:hypothetical protein BKA82DRAFT_4016109 [Pisolithus tinctorius]
MHYDTLVPNWGATVGLEISQVLLNTRGIPPSFTISTGSPNHLGQDYNEMDYNTDMFPPATEYDIPTPGHQELGNVDGDGDDSNSLGQGHESLGPEFIGPAGLNGNLCIHYSGSQNCPNVCMFFINHGVKLMTEYPNGNESSLGQFCNFVICWGCSP